MAFTPADLSRSFTVDIDVDLADGDDGVLVAHGDQGGGYSLPSTTVA